MRNCCFVSLIIPLILLTACTAIDKKNEQIPILKCKDCNVIIIYPNNLREDHLGLYGYKKDTTPNINEFAKDSMVFTNAFSQSSWSLPSVASLFTSKYPFSHGLMNRYELAQEETTLAEILKLYNYSTVAFTGGGDYKSIYGINQGFDIFNDGDNPEIFTGSFNITTKLALEWIEGNKDKKFFMFLQGYDAHCPYNPPEKYRTLFEHSYNGDINDSVCIRSLGFKDNNSDEYINLNAYYFDNVRINKLSDINRTTKRTSEINKSKTKNPLIIQYKDITPLNLTKEDVAHMINRYDNEIRYVDDLIGNFLKKLQETGIYGNTIIIFAGDHGESLDEHGRLGRTGVGRGYYYDGVLHIPLIIKHPYIKKAQKFDGLVGTIDIMPAILNFLDIPTPHEIQGLSLLPLINGSKPDLREFIFAGGRHGPGTYPFHYNTIHDTIRSKKWKLIFERSLDLKINNLELYNIENDPMELNNLIHEEPEIAFQLKKRLFNWEKSAKSKRNLKEVKLSSEEIGAIRRAGYLG